MRSMAIYLILLGVLLPDRLPAEEEEAAGAAGINERLDRALGAEGGVQVYMDAQGNVGTVIDQPGGDRTVTVQPPQSQSRNVGPPLQLHQPQPFIPAPATPPVSEPGGPSSP